MPLFHFAPPQILTQHPGFAISNCYECDSTQIEIKVDERKNYFKTGHANQERNQTPKNKKGS